MAQGKLFSVGFYCLNELGPLLLFSADVFCFVVNSSYFTDRLTATWAPCGIRLTSQCIFCLTEFCTLVSVCALVSVSHQLGLPPLTLPFSVRQ